MAQKYENLIFEPILSAYMLACQYLSMDFECLYESPPYALSKTIKITMGYYWHFLLQGNTLLIFKKSVCFEKSIMVDAFT